MKTIHLVCNSHIDPVWQWDWDEGGAAALATFYSACELADKYDFIFCHNEALLYEYVEKFDPELFERIKKLVEQGKWVIMGGWYVQPDVAVPSGESIIRQITLGREYFANRFGKEPKTALNFDSFAHSRGLVQILNKTGFDSYVFCRPMPDIDPLIHGPFDWVGYDNSSIKCLRIDDEGLYCTQMGKLKEEILRKINHYKDQDNILVLWGVGNHGGGPSRKDLEDIEDLKKEYVKEFDFKHSTLENYFESVNSVGKISKTLQALRKTYSSVSYIKKAHDELENELYKAEKVAAISHLNNLSNPNIEVFKNAEKTLAQIEFHDVLSGTAIESGTNSSIRKVHKAIEELKQESYKALYSIAKNLPKAKPGDDNFVIFNYLPYDVTTLVETEFIRNDASYSNITLTDENGAIVKSQIIKEESNVHNGKRNRIIYETTLPAMSVKQINVHCDNIPWPDDYVDNGFDLLFKDEYKTLHLNRNTGLIDRVLFNDVIFNNINFFAPYIFEDNEDPWGWGVTKLAKNRKRINLARKTSGIFEGLKPVTTFKNGPILDEIQCLFAKNNSSLVYQYKIYKNKPYFDINIHVNWNEKTKGLQVQIPVFNDELRCGSMYGIEKYKKDGFENPFNRYVYSKKGNDCFAILNKSGVHGASKLGSKINLTLLNGSAYCAHPVGENISTIPDLSRFVNYVEQGVHDFSFRVVVCKEEEVERYSNEFNNEPYSVDAFFHGDGKVSKDTVLLSNKNVTLSALKVLNDGRVLIRLFNGCGKKISTTLEIFNLSIDINISAYEFKTLVYDKNKNKILISKRADLY